MHVKRSFSNMKVYQLMCYNFSINPCDDNYYPPYINCSPNILSISDDINKINIECDKYVESKSENITNLNEFNNFNDFIKSFNNIKIKHNVKRCIINEVNNFNIYKIRKCLLYDKEEIINHYRGINYLFIVVYELIV